MPGNNNLLHLNNFLLLQSLLDDFVQHNVDTACALLESAGRFLYRLPETHTRMANMAEVRPSMFNLSLLSACHAIACTENFGNDLNEL